MPGSSGAAPALSDHQRQLDLWRDRLLEARKNYDLAVTKVKTVGTDFTSGSTPCPASDGSQKVVSFRAEATALKEYIRVLQIFTDLVVSGKKPEE